MVITHKIKMDLSRRGITPVVHMVQGDNNTRALEISLYDNGQPWEIPGGVTAAVAFSKADGTKGLYDKLPDGSAATTISGSTVTAILAPQALTCAGTVPASVVFYDKDMDTLATFPFKITVEANPAAGEQISNNYYYLQNLDQANQAYADILTRLDELKIEAGTDVPANAAQMKTLTIGEEIFEVVDEGARNSVARAMSYLETTVTRRTTQQFNKNGGFTVQDLYSKSDGSLSSNEYSKLISFPMAIESGNTAVIRTVDADKMPAGLSNIFFFTSDECPKVGNTYRKKDYCSQNTEYNDYFGYAENAPASSYMNIGVYCAATSSAAEISELLNFVVENLMVVKYPTRPTSSAGFHPDYEEYYVTDHIENLPKKEDLEKVEDKVVALEEGVAALEETVANLAGSNSSTMKFGVKWSVSDPDDLGTRCFNADGLTANIGVGASKGSSDFDNLYPWAEMKRCNIKTNASGASLVTYEGEAGFALDGSNGDVFVRVPKFTVERYTKDGYEYRVIGNPNAPVHEAFVENGKILDEIFVGAFEGYIANDKLRSIANVLPTSNEVPATYLDRATANGENYSLYDMRCVDAIWTLMAVEFGCRNTNQIIGYGPADYMQPVSETHLLIRESATNTNSVKVNKFYNYQKAWMPVGSNITICDTDQRNIVAQRKITKVEDTSDGLYTVFTFDGAGVNVTTNCFIGSAALNTNFCELCSAPLAWHTGRANFVNGSTTQNPIRYRWIENIVGNLWHFLPDVTFNNLQMYVCKDMQQYQFHKYTDSYKPVGDTLPVNTSNGSKNDEVDKNFWIDKLLNDTFAKSVLFAKSYNKALISTKAFGGYYYLQNGVMCIANGGGFDHLYRCNMLTQRAWIDANYKWYLCGARLMFKKIS